jgi:hypothetical protein
MRKRVWCAWCAAELFSKSEIFATRTNYRGEVDELCSAACLKLWEQVYAPESIS